MNNPVKIANFHYLTQDMPHISHTSLVEEACSIGIRWVQLRIKDKPLDFIKQVALNTLNICNKFGATLIINDHVELTKEIGAQGVHLGKSDMNPAKAREILGANFIIGGTANTFEDILNLVDAKVDYIGLGPFRFTSTKKNLSPVIGFEGYFSIMEKCNQNNITTPIIAIGGIKSADIDAIISTGVYGIAISSAINLSINKTAVISVISKQLSVNISKNTIELK